jgi:hypothetical protein
MRHNLQNFAASPPRYIHWEQDTLGSYSLTLVDALDTIALMGAYATPIRQSCDSDLSHKTVLSLHCRLRQRVRVGNHCALGVR